MDLQLLGRRAIVTGGARGIGKAVAHQLAAEGALVVIASRTSSELESTAAALRDATGGTVEAIVADTSDDASVEWLVARTVELFGGVDILVNNAASMGESARYASVLDVPIDVVATEYDNKPLAYLRCIRSAAPHMKANGWGRIINIAGLSARTTGNASSSMRQAAISALTKNAADELGPHGITVTTLHPGGTRTDRLADALGRLIEADEVAWVVTFLASPKSITLNGDSIPVNGGWRGIIDY
jgi:NAD(P)-dependent dehydrogenase (short-subunit alcohol dehydrogenase family)